MPPKKRGRPRKKKVGGRKKRKSSSSGDDDDLAAIGAGDEPMLLLHGKWNYSLAEKLNAPKFVQDHLYEEMDAKDLTLDYVRESGLKKPIYFKGQTKELGMKLPNPRRFTVKTVEQNVGAEREVDVVEVSTQRGKKMTVASFVRYYRQRRRRKLLNMLSLEYSHTPLAESVSAPAIVKQIDWVEQCWPPELRIAATSHSKWLYPKVQNYCLLSVKDCYTDFHLDFGGTSVWYHVLKGEKVFWMVPPTEQNLTMYEEWTLSGESQDQTFFGDVVADGQCARVLLQPGDTFFIPAGWIHGVYTPKDSIVFGGNFLHNFAIPQQLSVHESEQRTHIRKRFRYPLFVEMLWYVAADIVRRGTGRSYVNSDKVRKIAQGVDEFDSDNDKETAADSTFDSADVSTTTETDSADDSPETEREQRALEAELMAKAKMASFEAMRSSVQLQVKPEPQTEGGESVKTEPGAQISQESKPRYWLTEEDYVFPEFEMDYLSSLTESEKTGFRQLYEYLKKKSKAKLKELPIPMEAHENLLADLDALILKAEDPNHVFESSESPPPQLASPPKLSAEFPSVRQIDPTAAIVPLGHKPLETALRKGNQSYVLMSSHAVVPRRSSPPILSHGSILKKRPPPASSETHQIQPKRPSLPSVPLEAMYKDPRLTAGMQGATFFPGMVNPSQYRHILPNVSLPHYSPHFERMAYPSYPPATYPSRHNPFPPTYVHQPQMHHRPPYRPFVPTRPLPAPIQQQPVPRQMAVVFPPKVSQTPVVPSAPPKPSIKPMAELIATPSQPPDWGSELAQLTQSMTQALAGKEERTAPAEPIPVSDFNKELDALTSVLKGKGSV